MRCVLDEVASIVEPGSEGDAVYSRFYADPSCAGEQLANPHSGCRAPVYAVVNTPAGIPRAARPIVGQYEGATYWSTSDLARGNCVERDRGDGVLFRVGALVEPDAAFARIAKRTE